MDTNIPFSWVAAVLPEILLTVLLFTVQIYDRAAKPVERNRLGLVTAWGAFTILLITL
ncbi:MAG: hypothetical protein GY943_33390, partial [Chloroflexi bacterium]|nr:hypothetical protein [Chloroflexota bacterium]